MLLLESGFIEDPSNYLIFQIENIEKLKKNHEFLYNKMKEIENL